VSNGAVAPPSELETRLHAVVDAHYHHRHRFNRRMHDGDLSREELRRWILNRHAYQRCIPVKDALILARLPRREDRRRWLRRIIDQDGATPGEGGLDAWLRLADAAGVDRAALDSGEGVLPGVRFAVDAYVDFCRRRPWLEAVAASLTELTAPDLMSRRIDAFVRYYSWVAPEGLEYFRSRVDQGRRDASHALELVLEHAITEQEQDAVVAALRFKCDVLWALLDAVEHAHSPVGDGAGG
jgi:pyrroloquinoline-quinone synthase